MIIDVFSDPICPWCFIGKRRMERAFHDMPQDLRPQVRWRAFMLNPEMPPDGMERNAYLARKFGSGQRAIELYDVIAKTGFEEGILFAFGDIARTPSTVNAHRLIRHAATPAVQNDVVCELFDRYFLKGEDIGADDVLVEAAEAAGMDGNDVRAFLAGDRERDEILADHNLAQHIGINGVPCFILDGRYAVSGAQSPDVFKRMIETANLTAAE